LDLEKEGADGRSFFMKSNLYEKEPRWYHKVQQAGMVNEFESFFGRVAEEA
jgi:hypothetical protein